MKTKQIILTAIFCYAIFIFTGLQPVKADPLELHGQIHYYYPPETGAGATLMYGLNADLNFSSNFSLAAGVEYTTYRTGGHDYSLLPVTVDLIYRFTPGMPLDFYCGAGVGFYKKTIDNTSKTTTGGQLRAGADFNLFFFNAGLEARYIILSFNDFSLSSFSYGLQLGGSVFIPF